MELSDLLSRLAGHLERLQLRYLVTGSMATIVFGEPRFTNDIDIVVQLPNEKLADFCAAFPAPEFYCSREAAAKAVRKRFQFNILHPASGLKIDVMIPDQSEFNLSRFKRGIRIRFAEDSQAWFASPEDVIIKKLVFHSEGGSEKHVRDILGMIKIQRERIDEEYIAKWVANLGVKKSWNEIATRIAQDQE